MPRLQPPLLAFRDLDGVRLQMALPLLTSDLVRSLNARYRPWRKARPIARSAGVVPEAAWAAAKLGRLAVWTELPLTNAGGKPFGLTHFPWMAEQLHRVDKACGSGPGFELESPTGLLADPELRKRLAIRTMMEEAIESSRIEGAVTTRDLALDLLRTGRPPRTHSETMVANNYAGMRAIRTWLDRPLSLEMCAELQAILTRGTLESPDQCGRLRKPGERVAVLDERTSEVVHTPPAPEDLPRRMGALCAFANAEHRGDAFIHPIIKASILHFMIGYEHPFVDGNGRTARAVFYWFALRSGYRAFEYMAISELIRGAYASYPQAFKDTETDDNDLTYFVRYKLNVVRRAMERLTRKVREEEQKIARSLQLGRLDSTLNLRQRLLLEQAIHRPKTVHTAKSHATSSSITPMTARTDLEQLCRRGLMAKYKNGREAQYILAPDVPKRLADRAGEREET
jgi:Fic family protein